MTLIGRCDAAVTPSGGGVGLAWAQQSIQQAQSRKAFVVVRLPTPITLAPSPVCHVSPQHYYDGFWLAGAPHISPLFAITNNMNNTVAVRHVVVARCTLHKVQPQAVDTSS
jgi:hypothetical protein